MLCVHERLRVCVCVCLCVCMHVHACVLFLPRFVVSRRLNYICTLKLGQPAFFCVQTKFYFLSSMNCEKEKKKRKEKKKKKKQERRTIIPSLLRVHTSIFEFFIYLYIINFSLFKRISLKN